MRIFFIVIVISILTSCTVEKRLYRPGYHIESNLFSKSSTESEPRKEPTKLKPRQESSLQVETKELSRAMEAHSTLTNLSTACDTMVMGNGDKLIVKIETITENKITYRKCDNLEGPLYEESLSKVESLNFANGKVEKIASRADENGEYNVSAPGSQSSASNANQAKEKKPVEPFGLASIITFAVSWVTASILPGFAGVLSLASLVFAIISLVRFKDEPNKYRGKWMPLTVVVLFILGVIALLFLIAILFAAFG